METIQRLTTDLLKPFIGGQMQILDEIDGRIYRGEFTTAEITEHYHLIVILNQVAMGDSSAKPDGWVDIAQRHQKIILLEYYEIKKIVQEERRAKCIRLRSEEFGETIIIRPPKHRRISLTGILRLLW